MSRCSSSDSSNSCCESIQDDNDEYDNAICYSDTDETSTKTTTEYCCDDDDYYNMEQFYGSTMEQQPVDAAVECGTTITQEVKEDEILRQVNKTNMSILV